MILKQQTNEFFYVLNARSWWLCAFMTVWGIYFLILCIFEIYPLVALTDIMLFKACFSLVWTLFDCVWTLVGCRYGVIWWIVRMSKATLKQHSNGTKWHSNETKWHLDGARTTVKRSSNESITSLKRHVPMVWQYHQIDLEK